MSALEFTGTEGDLAGVAGEGMSGLATRGGCGLLLGSHIEDVQGGALSLTARGW